MADIKNVNSTNFEEEVLKSELPVMVDFWANWCAPCRAFMPVIEKVAADSEGKFKVVKLDIDEAHELAVQYKVKTIPTLMVFKDGKVSSTHIGRTSLENVMKMFE